MQFFTFWDQKYVIFHKKTYKNKFRVETTLSSFFTLTELGVLEILGKRPDVFNSER